jgi:hypothetical protein
MGANGFRHHVPRATALATVYSPTDRQLETCLDARRLIEHVMEVTPLVAPRARHSLSPRSKPSSGYHYKDGNYTASGASSRGTISLTAR